MNDEQSPVHWGAAGLRKGQWTNISNVPLSAQAIKDAHQPANAYRVSESSFPTDTYFCGTGVACRIYVLGGVFELALETDPDNFASATEGEYLEKPAGAFRVRVSDPEGARTVTTLPIPEQYSLQRDQ